MVPQKDTEVFGNVACGPRQQIWVIAQKPIGAGVPRSQSRVITRSSERDTSNVAIRSLESELEDARRDRNELGEKIYKIDYLSLNLKEREAQKTKDKVIGLEIENKYLISKDIKPVKSLSELKDIKELNNDFLLDETEIILSDFIQISENKGYAW